jgi:hypothetical protein
MKKITKRKGLTKEQLAEEKQRLIEAQEKRMGEIPFGRMLRCRVRYFTDGAVIGSREFVDEVFEGARHRFGWGPEANAGAATRMGPARKWTFPLDCGNLRHGISRSHLSDLFRGIRSRHAASG